MAEHFISAAQAETDLLDCAAFLAERIRSADGHAEAMNVIVPLYLGRGNVDLAAELANAVDDPFSRDRLLIAVAVKCAQIDDEEYALQLADGIEEDGLRAQSFEKIGLIFAGKGNAKSAERAASFLEHPEFVSGGVAINSASRGLDAESKAMLDSIDFPDARVSALQQIGAAKVDAGETLKGIEILQEAVYATDEIEHDEERIRALIELGNSFLDAKAFEKAVETFDKARAGAESITNQHRDFLLVTSALGFLNAGSIELADRTLDLVKDKTQMASALLGYARHYWSQNNKEGAEEALEEAYLILKSQREIETRDSKSRNALFVTIATQFVAYDKTQRGIEAALENPDHAQQTNAFAQISQILTVRGDDDQARDTIAMIVEDSDRLSALIAMADAKRKLSDNPAALLLLDEALGLTDAIPQISSRADVLTEIANRFADIEDRERARAAAVQSLETISQIRDESSRAAALAQLSTLYSSAAIEVGDEERELIGRLIALVAS